MDCHSDTKVADNQKESIMSLTCPKCQEAPQVCHCKTIRINIFGRPCLTGRKYSKQLFKIARMYEMDSDYSLSKALRAGWKLSGNSSESYMEAIARHKAFHRFLIS